MKALAINGSPRKGGNTETLLTRCLAKLAENGIETELAQIGGSGIRSCTACGYCHQAKEGRCAITDDCFQEFFGKMLEADIIVVGSPVYFGSATPDLMCLLDRAGYVGYPSGMFARKIGGPVTVARRAGQNFTYAQLLYWFTINGMIVPGSTYWNVGFGREKGEVEKDEEALRTVDNFAENLSWLAKKLVD